MLKIDPLTTIHLDSPQASIQQPAPDLEFAKAIIMGNTLKVKELIKQKCDINQSFEGYPALTIAIKRQQTAIVRLLLDQEDIDVNQADLGERPPLRHVAYSTTVIAQMLLEHPRTKLNPTDCLGNTPLLLAASNGFYEMTKQFIEMPGVDITAQDKAEKSTLKYVLLSRKLKAKKKYELASKLVFQGADFSFINDPKLTIPDKLVAQNIVYRAARNRLNGIKKITSEYLPDPLLNITLDCLFTQTNVKSSFSPTKLF